MDVARLERGGVPRNRPPSLKANADDAMTRQETIVISDTKAKATLGERAMHELQELVIISLYLYITLGAVLLLKTEALHAEGIAFAPWGVAIVKAVVLAKFILLGQAMKIGERTTTSPLVWPTLRKAFAFLVLLIILTVIEESIVGLFHGNSIATSLGDLVGRRFGETIASWLIVLLVLVPYFAFRILDEALGGRLAQMFFISAQARDR